MLTTQPERTDISITINVPAYRDQFVAEVAAHVADLNNGVNTLEAGTFEQNARRRTNAQGFTIEYTGTDIAAGGEQRQVETCFRAVIAAFITFLDRMIAVQHMWGQSIPIDQDLSLDAVVPYATAYINQKVLEVARNRNLTNPKKIDLFSGLPDWSNKAVKGYFLLRRCLEHHAGIPDADINLQWKGFRLFVGPKEIDRLPTYLPKGGSLSAGLLDGGKLLAAGTRATLSEQELRDIIFSLENVISLEVAQQVISSTAVKQP